MAENVFFITGATGHLGTEVVARLLATTTAPLRVLVRAATAAEASCRLRALWWDDAVLSAAVGVRVLPVTGDVTLDGLSLSEADRRLLLSTTTHVIHCAAETGVQRSKAELWRVNVDGTRRVAELARSMPLLQRFTYVSTAYVAGTLSGVVAETPSAAHRFYSLYEQSKAEAERLVSAAQLPLTICRPGMIVGNSVSGRTRNFNTVYYVLRLLLQGRLWLLPVSRHQTVNVVPVDYVARQVADLTLHPDALGRTFHLTPPAGQLPQVGELVDEVRRWALAHLQTDVRRPLYVPLPVLRRLGRRYNSGTEAKSRSLWSNLTALMPYFLDDHRFDRSNTDRLTGPYRPDWHTFLPVLLDFACRHNFMRLTSQSIFEQAVVRRESRRYPITYYNITAQGVERVTGREMNARVAHYAGLLRSCGVQPGDRVALAGVNCTDHAAIDSAIGLCGATSVPIYYTTPADEIALLLGKSGARWFFVGDERVMQNLQAVGPGVQVVTFGPLSPPDGPGAHAPAGDAAPALLSQSAGADPVSSVATIRYTSGTTGEPKGVMFSPGQLKWMGQVLTNLLPWRDRNREMRYLSFLPMSHVVEGILAAYAPYCMLCRARIYYLNDFQQLSRALPLVQPTVFFSVPRFYEKLWQQLEGHPLYRRYQGMADGALRRAVGRVLRRAVLRRAGLHRCSQLLVGSAPVSEELLRRFRDLGIEIYNAYGQTEAPLITLNRLGDNVIPSIGTPLPDTTVSTAPDGELIVSGPQVALGYYRLPSATFSAGHLHTGDLGRIAPDGHVYIEGRKKDMLITSYGKNINCAKIEQLLAGLPGVEQAVLVGEQRPYLSALLWGQATADELRPAIERMNGRLSHPEQVRRWRVVATPLSLARGELTPNLKVKRAVVWQHYQADIQLMYETSHR